MLDAVAAGGVPGYRRLAHGASACGGPRRAARCAAVAAGVDLVALVCEPPLGEDERPSPPPLVIPA